MSLRNLSKAKVALTLSIFGLVLVFLINFYTGLMTFAKYGTCDPLKAGQIDAIDQLVPFYVMETFSQFTTFVGIFVAGIFAASLGTVAACLSSLSAVTIEDLLINGINIKITPEMGTRYAKWMNFGYGVASFGLIFLVEGRGILQATLTLNGLVGGLLLGLFSLGIFFKKANAKGALYGGLLAAICVLTLGIFALANGVDEPFLKTSTDECNCFVNATLTATGPPVIDDEAWYTSIYKVSYMWYSMIGTLLTVVFGLLISVLTQYYEERQIAKISASAREQVDNIGRFTPNSLSTVTRKVSTVVQTMTHDMTAKIDNRPPILHSKANDLDEIDIMNDETIQVGGTSQNTTSVIGLFGIDNQALIINDEVIRK